MITQLLSLLSALIWLVAGAPDTASSVVAKPKFSIYEVTFPLPNQVVTEKVDIIGSVNSPDMRSYFVEFYALHDDGTGDWFPATLPGIVPVFADRIGTFNTAWLPDGEYDLRLRVITGADSESTLAFGPVVVRNSQKAVLTPTPERRAIATVSVDSPKPGQVVSGSVDIVGTVDAPDLRNFYIEFKPADGASADTWFPATLPKIESVRSGLLGSWYTLTLKDGDYLLRINVLAGAEPRQYFPIGRFRVRNGS